MPDVEVERKLLCGTCMKPESLSHGPHTPCRDFAWSHSADSPFCNEYHCHPFDGVPYVRCHAGCDGGWRSKAVGYGGRSIDLSGPCPRCANSPLPGWVQEEA